MKLEEIKSICYDDGSKVKRFLASSDNDAACFIAGFNQEDEAITLEARIIFDSDRKYTFNFDEDYCLNSSYNTPRGSAISVEQSKEDLSVIGDLFQQLNMHKSLKSSIEDHLTQSVRNYNSAPAKTTDTELWS